MGTEDAVQGGAPGQGERHSTALQGLWFPLCGNAALGCTGKYLYCPNVFSIGKKMTILSSSAFVISLHVLILSHKENDEWILS